MQPADYTATLSRAIALHRSGYTEQSIAGMVGGTDGWWRAMLIAAGEYAGHDDLRETILDMKGSGRSVVSIAEKLNIDVADVRAALEGRTTTHREPVWDGETQRAMLVDYENGMTIKALAMKYGYRNGRVAMGAIRRARNKWRI